MPVVRAVFERGLEAHVLEERWTLSGALSVRGNGFQDLPGLVATMSPLRLVLVTDRRADGSDLTLLLRPTTGDYFGTCASDLTNRPLAPEMVYPVHHLAYLLAAVSYHCQQLAEVYVDISTDYSRMTQLTGQRNRTDRSLFGGQAKPYFEFDALLSAARRSYDSLRYILWPKYGRRGSMPRSIESLLAAQTGIPQGLHNRLAESWHKTGVLLTEYRDCIHHYVPVDFAFAAASMERSPLQLWTMMIRIPDNPDARSKARFTFATGRDALTYGWEVGEEILSVGLEVVDAVQPRRTDA